MVRKRRPLDFKRVVDTAYDHIVVTDLSGKIVYANPAVTTTTGYSNKEVIGATPRLWGGLMPTSFYKELWHTIKVEQRPFVGVVTNKRKDGTVYVADVRISPVFNRRKKVQHYIGIERDITAMQQLDTSRNEFISLVSHQIRTPLSTLNWYSEALQDEDAGKLNHDQKQYVTEIYDATQRMIKLVNSLLNSTRIDFGNIRLQATDVNLFEVINDIIRDCKASINKKHLKVINNITQEKHITISSDRPLVSIIFENLITNAIKYTPPKGTVTIDAEPTETGVIISVKDTGYGIAASDKHKIFTKYFRSEQIKKISTEGTGLGLFITKSYIAALGGSIDFVSSSKGTTFRVTLPNKLSKEVAS